MVKLVHYQHEASGISCEVSTRSVATAGHNINSLRTLYTPTKWTISYNFHRTTWGNSFKAFQGGMFTLIR